MDNNKTTLLETVKDAFRKQRGLYIFCITVAAVYTLIALRFESNIGNISEVLVLSAESTGPTLLIFFVLFAAYLPILSVIKSIYSGDGLKGLVKHFDAQIERFFRMDMLIMGAVGFLPLIFCWFFVGVAKSLIPYLADFHWDPIFMQWDAWLHFGHHPHDLLLPIIQKLKLVKAVDFLYFIWFFVMIYTQGYVLFCDQNMQRRMQFLWTFVLSWFAMGCVLSTVMASVGPVYYGYFYPENINIYQALIDHIYDIHESGISLKAIALSEMLLEFYQSERVINYNGISAMPSMHIALAWLWMLYGFAFNRWLGLLALIYLICMQIGAVYLGWHYAIDGYVSVILLSIIWWVCGKAVKRFYH